MINKFNIRVYGLLFSETGKEVLVSNEKMNTYTFSKFPGGGLEFGEGAIDCLKREFLEELGVDIEVDKHFYTTDFFQQSGFSKEQQIISIYYIVKLQDLAAIKTSKRPFVFNENIDKQELFTWEPIDDLLTEKLTFPIDKIVAEQLFKQFT